MPERNERKYHQDASSCETPRAAEWDVEVTYDPEVVWAVPCAPEAERRVFVRHVAYHVLGRVHSVHECPQAEETPGEQQLT